MHVLFCLFALLLQNKVWERRYQYFTGFFYVLHYAVVGYNAWGPTHSLEPGISADQATKRAKPILFIVATTIAFTWAMTVAVLFSLCFYKSEDASARVYRSQVVKILVVMIVLTAGQVTRCDVT